MANTPKPVRKAAKKIVNTYASADKANAAGKTVVRNNAFKKATSAVNSSNPKTLDYAKKIDRSK